MRSKFDDRDPPDVGDVVARVASVAKQSLTRFGSGFVVLVAILIAIAGVYKVGPGELGVVRTLGRQTGKTVPGLHFRLPLVQRVDVVNVEQIRRMEIGARDAQRVAGEALMITGDANIVEVQMIVQYRVVDPSKYLFKLKDPDDALRATAEVALRSVVGRTNIDEVITTGREKVQAETQQWLQKLMNDYQSGISVTEVKLQAIDAPDEVKDAFHEVVRAREEKEKLINQAMGYEADLIPRARGESEKMKRDAEGYKEKRVLEASGDASRFDQVFAEYKKAERVTKQRLYLESLERVVAKTPKKVIVDANVAKNAVPVLPLGTNFSAPAEGGKK
ncbi:MAG: FtsH protease activity modulator HflK [Polyangiaceae bacterium]